jgi:hypothetical protein
MISQRKDFLSRLMRFSLHGLIENLAALYRIDGNNQGFISRESQHKKIGGAENDTPDFSRLF